MIIDYSVQKTFEQSIDIVDPGNTALMCTNDGGSEWYVIIKTIAGMTSAFSFGPVSSDLPVLNNGFFSSYSRFDYKERTIQKIFTGLINDPRKEITDVREIDQAEAWQAYPKCEQLFNED